MAALPAAAEHRHTGGSIICAKRHTAAMDCRTPRRRICVQHPNHPQTMCLIPSPYNPSQVVVQLEQSEADAHRQWCMDDHNIVSPEGRALSLHIFTNSLVLTPPAHPEPTSSSHERMEHNLITNQAWEVSDDGHICALPHRELCLVVDNHPAHYRPTVASYRHSRSLIPGWTVD